MKQQKSFYMFFFVFFLIGSPKFTQESIKTSFEISEGKIFIYYELSGEKDKEYEVSIKLKRTSVKSFEIVPSELAGDVGEGKFAGKKNTIIWHLNDKEKTSLDGDDYYFEIYAKRISSGGGGIPWYYYVGGALVGGGAAAVLTLGKKNSGTEKPVESTTLPTPPARPGN